MVREGFTSSEYEIYVDLFNRALAHLKALVKGEPRLRCQEDRGDF